MKILDKYLFRILLHGFGSALGIIAGLLILQRLYKVVDLALRQSIGVFETLALLLWALPLVFFYSLPLAAVVAALLTFGRLAGDSELHAAMAAGVSRLRLARIPLYFAGIITFAALLNNMLLMPLGYVAFDNVGFGIGVDPMQSLKPGVVQRVSGRHIVMEKIDHDAKTFEKLFAVVPAGDIGYGKGKVILIARSGRWNLDAAEISLELENGEIREISEAERIRTVGFGAYTLRVPVPTARYTEVKRLTIFELVNGEPEKRGEHLREIARRALEAFSIPALLFCSIGLALPRGGSGTRSATKGGGTLWLTFVIYFGYWILTLLSQTAMMRYQLSPVVLAAPHAILLAIGGILWRR